MGDRAKPSRDIDRRGEEIEYRRRSAGERKRGVSDEEMELRQLRPEADKNDALNGEITEKYRE